ncbi:MAG: glycosyltransferase family 39 protein [Betaproteobacteria bacterium]|nr:glycosyltransferase family 39 protein [Betaproteobacteria bacterium]
MLLGALLAVLWVGVLGLRDLVPTDEGRYAEIPREMVASGDWVTPRLDGFKYFEKPPLQYWATAASYELFGIGQWQARLWTGLTGLLGIAFTAFAGCLLWGRRVGLYAGAVLASCVYWLAMGHINTLDMGVSACLGGSLLSFLLAQRDGVSRGGQRAWMLACWGFMGLSLLSKGLIGLAFPGMTLVLYTLWSRDWGLWRRLHILPGLAVLLAVALPWHVLVQQRNPEFFGFYFIYQQFDRFATPDLSRPGPWYYFIPIVLLGIMPWLGALFPALARSARRAVAPPADEASGSLRTRRVLLVWAVFIFGFFSASHSKLPSYVLPMFPALALLLGEYLAHARQRALGWQFGLWAAVSAAAAIAFTQLWRAGNAITPGALYQQYGWWLEVTAACGLVGALAAWRWERQGRRALAVLGLAGCMVAGLTVATQAFQILGRTASTRDVVRSIRPWLHAGQPFYTVGTYDQTLPFYLRREVTVVQYRGELDFGIRQQPSRWVPTLSDFAARWRAGRLPLAFMPAGELGALRALGLPLLVIDQTPRYVVVARPDQDYGAAANQARASLPAAWNPTPADPAHQENPR